MEHEEKIYDALKQAAVAMSDRTALVILAEQLTKAFFVVRDTINAENVSREGNP